MTHGIKFINKLLRVSEYVKINIHVLHFNIKNILISNIKWKITRFK